MKRKRGDPRFQERTHMLGLLASRERHEPEDGVLVGPAPCSSCGAFLVYLADDRIWVDYGEGVVEERSHRCPPGAQEPEAAPTPTPGVLEPPGEPWRPVARFPGVSVR